MKIQNALRPPTTARLDWFEDAFNVTLPESYVEFLQTGNGGVPVENKFMQGKKERMIERFLCILEAPSKDEVHGWYDISVVLTQIEDRLLDDDDIVGSNVIPIAELFGGDKVCLDFRENEEDPSVVVWLHEESEELEPAFVKVANSFPQFLGMLRA